MFKKGKTIYSEQLFYWVFGTWSLFKVFRNISRERSKCSCFFHCLPCQLHPDKSTKWQNTLTFCFLSVFVKMLFSEELLLGDLFSESFSFAIFSFSCKYSISDFCETIKVSKLDKDGRWNTYFKKYMCKYNYVLYYLHTCKYLNIIYYVISTIFRKRKLHFNTKL